jgi:hypothetical protein
LIQAILTLIALVVLTLGGAAGYEKLRADHAFARAETAEADLHAAEQRAAALALLWQGAVEKAGADVQRQKEIDDANFAKLQARADALAQHDVVVSAALAGLLRDVSRAANAARAATGHSDAAPTVPYRTGSVAYAERAIARFIVQAGHAYADAYGKWQACVTTYNALRAQQEGQQ